MSYSTLQSAVVAKLQTVSELANVFASHRENPTGFPSASCEPSSHENVIYTNTDNLRSYIFDVIIYQEFSTISRDEAVQILAKATDAVITAFDTDYNLGGACDFCLALPGAWGFFESGNANVIYAQLTLTCKKEVTVYP